MWMRTFSSFSRARSSSARSGSSSAGFRPEAFASRTAAERVKTGAGYAGPALRFLLSGAVLFTLLLPAGCGRGRQSKYLVGFSQCNLGEPWRVAMNAEVAARARDFPEMQIVYADAQQDNARQVADVENFLRQKIDLLLISPN